MRTAAAAAVAVVAAGLLAGVPTANAAERSTERFPRGFLWGTANSGFQSEMGANRHLDRGSDWWRWTHDPANIAAGRVSGDQPERGPGHWARFREDVDLARDGLRSNAYRLSIEWSRIFPRSTTAIRTGGTVTRADLRRLDRIADPGAVAHYRRVLEHVRRRGMTAFATVNHFALPSWLHDPIAARDALTARGPDADVPAGLRRAGWLDPASVTEFRKYSAYVAWKYGELVDLWSPVNEPLVVATSGYANIPGAFAGNFPPGAFTYAGAIAVVRTLIRANAVAYDAVKTWDRGDADGDGRAARVGLVQNLVAFTPSDPASARDVEGTRHADHLFNRLFLNAAVRGWTDADADAVEDPGERSRRQAGKADFIGVNYYFRGRVTGLGAALTPRIGVLDFLPVTEYRTPEAPAAPPCPTTCTEFGWEIHPQGLRDVLEIAGGYRLPVYITENGIADADDDQRPGYLVSHLQVLRRAIGDRVADVRGYFHWSLVDNFEWSSGYQPRFGLYAYDPASLRRRARPSARHLRAIAGANAIPPALARRYGPASSP